MDPHIPEGMKEVLWKEMNGAQVLGHRYYGTRGLSMPLQPGNVTQTYTVGLRHIRPTAPTDSTSRCPPSCVSEVHLQDITPR